jgi:hypothetical protein
VQGLHWTVYCYSAERDEHYALIKYNNYLYSVQLIFTLLARKKTHLNLTRQILIILWLQFRWKKLYFSVILKDIFVFVRQYE